MIFKWSIDRKKQSEHSGLRADTSSLAYNCQQKMRQLYKIFVFYNSYKLFFKLGILNVGFIFLDFCLNSYLDLVQVFISHR